MSYESVPTASLRRLSPISRCARRRTRRSPVATLAAARRGAAARTLPRAVPPDRGPWLWFSRLLLDDAHLAEIIQHPRVDLYSVLDEAGREAGMLELDFREPGECELAFIGLRPDLAGQGHGRWLLAEAVRRAWREGVDRVHVHTCSLDHPAALSAYRRAGFIPFKRAVERFPDPRLAGILPRDSAPQVPLLGTDA